MNGKRCRGCYGGTLNPIDSASARAAVLIWLVAAGYLVTACGATSTQRASSPTPASFPALVGDGDAVFFVGNSFFGAGGRPLPEWVAALGEAVSPPVHLRTGSDIVFGNLPLAAFLEHEATRDALSSHEYRVYVLQGEEFEPVDRKAAFHQAVRDFNKAVVAAGGRTVLFMTWEFHFRPFIDALAASYDEIGSELGIPVIPAGIIYKDCDRRPYRNAPPYWLTASAEKPAGDLHQNEKGTAVNTYATFAMLTGLDPMGATFEVPGNTNSNDAMKYFSAMAWARVAPRLTAIKPVNATR